MINKTLLFISSLLIGSAQDAVPMKAIKGIPFTAKAVTEIAQTLENGNHIARSTSAQIARDSEGRTRREQNGVVYLQDPVLGLAYVIDTQSKSFKSYPIRLAETSDNRNEVVALGNQFVGGFLAEGSRLKKIIPADKAGNKRPLEVVSETWFSQQLQTVIEHRTIDPRVGTAEYKLIEIELGDPAPELFVVPKN